MAVIEIAKIQVRRGQELQTGIPQLDPGEFGWAEDTQHLYIGKRIVEGANSDDNTRILTENDLANVFELINSTSSNILKYQYRDDIQYFKDRTTVRNVSDKLDEFVSVLDFDTIQSGVTSTNITLALEKAVKALYGPDRGPWNDTVTADGRRVLKIPAGRYTVSTCTNLPPYAIIEGEGAGLTTITLTNSGTGIFRTIDADGTKWEGLMDSGVKRSRDVVIKGLTLEYAVTATSNNPLISLDNVLNPVIENVEFRTTINSTSTTTYGLVSHGVGIRIRGQGGGIASGDANLCENVQIRNCRFDSLLTAIDTTGSVVKSLVEHSVFSNLSQGITLSAIDTTPGPSNGYFLNNRFQNIVREGISVGTQTNAANHISENNFFIQVGNGTTLDDTTSSTASSIINFYSEGCKSVNDYFYRQKVANETSSTTFYYNPLVNGEASVVSDTVYVVTFLPVGLQSLTKIPLNGLDQKFDLDYKISTPRSSYTRSGRLLINISAPAQPGNVFYLATPASTGATSLNFSYTSTSSFSLSNGVILSGVPGLAAGTTVTNIAGNIASISQPVVSNIGTGLPILAVKRYDEFGSISDYYNFSYVDEWPFGDPSVAVFSLGTPKKNYLELFFNNWSQAQLVIEYQLSRSS